MPKKLWWLMIPVALAVVYFAMPRATDYTTVTPTRGKAVQAVYGTGEVEPVYWAKVSPLLPGRIALRNVEEGSRVLKGDVLAQLDDSLEKAREQEYLARLEYLQKEVARQKQLSSQSFSSRRVYEAALSDYKATEAALTAHRETLRHMSLVAPIDGVVLQRDFEIGEYVKPENVLFWVGKPTPLRVTAEIDEEDIPLVAVGQNVLIKADAFPGSEIKGTVAEVTPRGDPLNKNFRVRIALPQHTPLNIGMTVEVNIISQEKSSALLVPTTSLMGDQLYVLEGGRPVLKRVTPGIRGESQTEIVEGLPEEARVLVDPRQAAKAH